MKSRALVHSNYESRLLGARPQGGFIPAGAPGTGMTGRLAGGRPATEQVPLQSRAAGFQSQPVRLPRA